jgi:hypothetical protein
MKVFFKMLISKFKTTIRELKRFIGRDDNDRFNDPYIIF